LYVLREFCKVFGLALLACTLFMLIATIFITTREYEEYGVSVGQISLLFPYLLPKPLALAIPLAAMIAATMVFGRMSAENEIQAVQSGGAPIRVLALPILLISTFLCLISLCLNQWGLEWGTSTIRSEILKVDNPAATLKNLEKEGASVTHKTEEGGMVRINVAPHETDLKTGKVLRPIQITTFEKDTVGRTILAQNFTYDPSQMTPTSRTLVIKLLNMQVLDQDPFFTHEFVTEFNLPRLSDIGNSRSSRGWLQNYADAGKLRSELESRYAFLLRRMAEFGAQAAAGSAMSPAAPGLCSSCWADARLSWDSIHADGGALENACADEIEFWCKIALGLLPISLGVLGIGLGLLVRKSQRLVGFLLGILVYVLVYYPLLIFCQELVLAGAAGFWVIWVPNVFLLLLGYALWRAYERGRLAALPGWLAVLTTACANWLRLLWHELSRPFSKLHGWSIGLLRYKADGYMAGSFLVPLLVVLFSVGGLFVALDVMEHGSQIVEGILRANENIATRTSSGAIMDVAAYYAISVLEWICDLLPLILLLAGVLCIYMLVRNSEHLILKSSGVPLQRAFRPIIGIALILSVAVVLLRETVMPGLILRRDQLKALVYSKSLSSTALSLYTTDMEGQPVIFQMSQYSSRERSGRDLRVYLLSEAKGRRIPAIIADFANWNGKAWSLQIDPNRGEAAQKQPLKPLLNYGFKVVNTEMSNERALRPVLSNKCKLAEWAGGVTPAIIESERLGGGVMGMSELLAASHVKREFSVELWRRLPEVLMGLFLLWSAIPLLLKEEVRRPLLGVGFSILLGALYWALNVGSVEAARVNLFHLPTWTPLFPHILFLCFGFWQYHVAMET
jgi:lipopolysaccharide export LptBFGC system permease protein LptF